MNQNSTLIQMARPIFTEKAARVIAAEIRNGAIATGPLVLRLEEQLAQQFQHAHVAACSNGTAALHAALFALGVKAGDCVVTTALSFVASASAIVHAGATPVFCDIDDSYNLDPERLEQAITRLRRAGRRVSAVVFVHLYGNPTNVARVQAICRKHEVPLLEDCAQAHGAQLANRGVAHFGEIATFSFYATKNIAAGEGGAVVSSDPALVERVRKFINHGRTSAYEHEFVGYNYRMTNLHAALALDQLEQFESNLARRTANSEHFRSAFAAISALRLPRVEPGARHAMHQFTVIVPPESRDPLAAHLLADGIRSAVVYPTPLPYLKCFESLRPAQEDSFERARAASTSCLSIPVHPMLERGDLVRIVDSMIRFFPTGASR